MCQQIVQFCSGSGKPLILAGSLALLLGALAIGYSASSTRWLFLDIDPSVAGANSIAYHLELSASLYMTLVAIFATHAAYYDQKQLIRVLAILSSINFLLAAGSLILVPTREQLVGQVLRPLEEARKAYNFTEPRTKRSLEAANGTQVPPPQPAAGNETSVSQEMATRIWDQIQARGCCGIRNATEDWGPHLPKSCCDNPKQEGALITCHEVDERHQRPCVEIVAGTGMQLALAICLLALANLYLASVSGCISYWHFHYDEASQSAYT